MKRKKSDTTKMKEKAWKEFSRYIRLYYSDDNGYCTCITCGGIYYWKDIQAGHFVPGRNNSVLINENIVYPQCYSCNCGSDKGKPYEYLRAMLKMGYSLKKIDEFQALKHKTLKVSKAEWEEKYLYYKDRVEKILKTKKLEQ